MYKWFLTVRYLVRRRIAYFSVLAVALAVAMVIVVYSVMSGFLGLMQGNVRHLSGDIIIENEGLESFPLYDEFIAHLLETMPGRVVGATPIVRGFGLLKFDDPRGSESDLTFVIKVRGIRLDEYQQINSFSDSLFYNKYYPGTTSFEPASMPTWHEQDRGYYLPPRYEVALAAYCAEHDDPLCVQPTKRKIDDGWFLEPGRFAEKGHWDSPEMSGRERHGVIVGSELVIHRSGERIIRLYPKGSELNITVLVPTVSGKVSPNSGRTVTVRYCDDSETRVFEVDSRTVYFDFDWLQGLLDFDSKKRVDGLGRTPPRASEIQIKLVPGADVDSTRAMVEDLWRRMIDERSTELHPADVKSMRRATIHTWRQKHSDYIAPVEKERVLVLVLFVLISGVAIAVVGCIFYLIVQEKTRDIGIIKSLGATAGGVASIFVSYAMAVGVVGSMLGTVAGVMFVRNINWIQELLVRINPGLRVWSPDVYAFDRIPDTVEPVHVAWIVVVAIFASGLGSVAASWRAARVWPVKSLRFD